MKIKLPQLRGMLLEEALLYLLRNSGYDTVEDALGDPETLLDGPAGLKVKGRGSWHQIDAVADYVLPAPFSHPPRLLTEAKCLSRPVGLATIRNAVGVLKDVSELWVCSSGTIPKRRYHYQYAVFSASGYSKESEKYAFAQDIYLIPIGRSAYLRPLIASITNIKFSDFGIDTTSIGEIVLKDLRRKVRRALKASTDELNIPNHFLDVCKKIDNALLVVVGKTFPIFLVPAEGVNIQSLGARIKIRVRYDRDQWYIESDDEKTLFSFDLPEELVNLYGEGGFISKGNALRLKGEFFTNMRGLYRNPDRSLSVVCFEMDKDWFDAVKDAKLPTAGRRGEVS